MDICHSKNAELEAKHHKYNGRVVLRGDIVKDDSGAYAVFTEQRSSGSQVAAAKVMDIISRLQGCDGQAADAVSAYTQVKMEDAHKSFQKKFQNRNVQTFGFCKEYISTTEKWLRKLYVYSMNNINMSDEDKHDTNYINKNDTNTYTRKLHKQ